MVQQAAFLVLPALVTFAAISDLFTMTISNRLCLLLLAGFAAVAPLAGFGPSDAALHLATAAAVLAVTFGLFAAGWIGGGDAKFVSAIALWMGPAHVLPFLALTALAGGVLTVAILLLRRMPMPALALRAPWFARLQAPETGVPYGIALAAGALVQYPRTPFMTLVGG